MAITMHHQHNFVRKNSVMGVTFQNLNNYLKASTIRFSNITLTMTPQKIPCREAINNLSLTAIYLFRFIFDGGGKAQSEL